MATDNLRTFSDINTTVYDGLELSANMRKDKLLLFGGVTTDKRASTHLRRARQPEQRALLRRDAAVPHHLQAVGGLSAAVGLPVERLVHRHARPERRRQLHRDGGHRRPADHRLDRRRHDDQREPDEPNTVFLDYKKQLDLRLARNFRFGTHRIQGFADIFNLLNAGTVLRVNETYGQPRDQRVADAADDHGRPLPALRHADEFLTGRQARRLTGYDGPAARACQAFPVGPLAC